MRGARDAQFGIGQLVEHRIFGYKEGIDDADATFSTSEEWYEHVARTRPPRDLPCYYVLVHGSDRTTDVAERDLAESRRTAPTSHPPLARHLTGFEKVKFVPRRSAS